MTKHLLVLGLASVALVACSRDRFTEAEAGKGPGGEIAARNTVIGLSAEERGRWLTQFGLGQELRYALLESVTIPEDRANEKLVGDLLSAIDECGLEDLGPACLDGVETLDLNLNNDGFTTTVTARVRMNGDAPLVDLTFDFDPTTLPQHRLNLTATTADGKSPLFTSQVSTDFVPRAWARLGKPRTIRELYHMTRDLLDLRVPDAMPQLARIFSAHIPLLVAVGRENYEFETLLTALTELPVAKPILSAMGDELLTSASRDVDELAAIAVLTGDPGRTFVRPLVIGALSNPRQILRLLGENALGQATNRSTDQTALLLKQARDADLKVRGNANRVISETDFDYGQRPDVMALALNPDPSVRQTGIKLLRQIRDPADLVKLLNDPESSVRLGALNALTPSQLNYVVLDALVDQLQKNPDPQIRAGVAALLGQSDNQTAREALVTHMADPENMVRESATHALWSHAIDSDMVEPLDKMIVDSNAFAVQREAVNLMSAIRSWKAKLALVPHLSALDPEVRQLVFEKLMALAPSVDTIGALKAKLSDNNPDVRLKATQLLARIQHPDACLAIKQPCGGKRKPEIQSEKK